MGGEQAEEGGGGRGKGFENVSGKRERERGGEREKKTSFFACLLVSLPFLVERAFFFFIFSLPLLNSPVLEAVELPAGVSDLDACVFSYSLSVAEGGGGGREEEEMSKTRMATAAKKRKGTSERRRASVETEGENMQSLCLTRGAVTLFKRCKPAQRLVTTAL